MAIKAIRFNKSILMSRVQHNKVGAVRDTEISGLKFKVGARRSVFIFEKRVSGRKNAPAVTITIGAFPAVSVEEARQEARRLANLCERGIDPRQENSNEPRTVLTVRMMTDKFFAVKKELRPNTLQKYRNIVENHIPAKWMARDITHITPDRIVTQFHAIREHATETCWEFLKVIQNIWHTCAPFFRDANKQRILKVSPMPEVRNMLKTVPRNNPKRSVIPASLLGKFVATLERLRMGELSMDPVEYRQPTPVEIRMIDIALLTLFTAFRFVETQCLKWEYVDLDKGTIWLPGDTRGDCQAIFRLLCESKDELACKFTQRRPPHDRNRLIPC